MRNEAAPEHGDAADLWLVRGSSKEDMVQIGLQQGITVFSRDIDTDGLISGEVV